MIFNKFSYKILALNFTDTYLYSPEVTHVITMCNESKMTEPIAQYICGVVSGKWILSQECEYDI